MAQQPGSGWDSEQLDNARTIISVGMQMGMSQRDIRVALMTAMQESGLHNVNYGDADSLGLFQQRPSMGWGTPEQVMDPQYAATKFFQGLKAVDGRDSMRLTEEAQAVQRSAYPDAYAQWSDDAAKLIQSLGLGGDAPAGSGDHIGAGFQPLTMTSAPQSATSTLQPVAAEVADSIPALQPVAQTVLGIGAAQPFDGSSMPFTPIPSRQQFAQDTGNGSSGGGTQGWRHDLVRYAKQFIGVPYVWGGSSPSGFDCSGLVQYVASHFGIDLPRISNEQATSGKRIDLSQLKPGDLVAWDNSSRNNGADHIAIYIGHGMILEAPRPGLSVQVSNLYDQNIAWGVRMHG